jgi:aspartate racemase
MKTVGLLGGMSWESSALYYAHLNRGVKQRLGGLHSARVLLLSLEFNEIAAWQAQGDWPALRRAMVESAHALEKGGAEILVICSNTMHRLAGDVAGAVTIPLLHIADVTAAAIHAAGVRRPLLMATRFTVQDRTYHDRLRERHGVTCDRLPADGEEAVHAIIYNELCQGRVEASSRRYCLDLIAKAQAEGADGLVLGCTELTMLLSQADVDIPVFDTTLLHAQAAIDFALAGAATAHAGEALQ